MNGYRDGYRVVSAEITGFRNAAASMARDAATLLLWSLSALVIGALSYGAIAALIALVALVLGITGAPREVLLIIPMFVMLVIYALAFAFIYMIPVTLAVTFIWSRTENRMSALDCGWRGIVVGGAVVALVLTVAVWMVPRLADPAATNPSIGGKCRARRGRRHGVLP